MDTNKSFPETFRLPAKPHDYIFPAASTALLMIDMQRIFLLPSGFGVPQSGSDLGAVQDVMSRIKRLLEGCRQLGLPVLHTREGHLPKLLDCPSSKLIRQAMALDSGGSKNAIRNSGAKGRSLVRGEYGHDMVDDCGAKPWEVVIDKAGKGAFWNTSLHEELLAWGITHLIVGGVTTEYCVTTTVREANDRGFECCKWRTPFYLIQYASRNS